MKLKDFIKKFNIYIIFIINLLMLILFYNKENLSVFTIGFIKDVFTLYIINFIIFKFLKGKCKKIIYSIYMGFITLIFNIDILYYSNYKTISRIAALSSLKWLEGSYGLTIPLVGYILIVLCIISIIIVCLSEQNLKSKIFNYILGISIIFILFVELRMAFRPEFESFLEYHDSPFYLYDKITEPMKFCEKWGYFYYHIVDIIRSL